MVQFAQPYVSYPRPKACDNAVQSISKDKFAENLSTFFYFYSIVDKLYDKD